MCILPPCKQFFLKKAKKEKGKLTLLLEPRRWCPPPWGLRPRSPCGHPCSADANQWWPGWEEGMWDGEGGKADSLSEESRLPHMLQAGECDPGCRVCTGQTHCLVLPAWRLCLMCEVWTCCRNRLTSEGRWGKTSSRESHIMSSACSLVLQKCVQRSRESNWNKGGPSIRSFPESPGTVSLPLMPNSSYSKTIHQSSPQWPPDLKATENQLFMVCPSGWIVFLYLASKLHIGVSTLTSPKHPSSVYRNRQTWSVLDLWAGWRARCSLWESKASSASCGRRGGGLSAHLRGMLILICTPPSHLGTETGSSGIEISMHVVLLWTGSCLLGIFAFSVPPMHFADGIKLLTSWL